MQRVAPGLHRSGDVNDGSERERVIGLTINLASGQIPTRVDFFTNRGIERGIPCASLASTLRYILI